MKLISWNVNGIRAIMKKNFLEFLLVEKPDVLCLQEVKISESSKNDANLDFPGTQNIGIVPKDLVTVALLF